MTIGIVAAAIVFWPAAPLFLLMHGKEITFPRGTDVPTFINGDMKLDIAKFQQAEGSSMQALVSTATSNIAINSNPGGAEIYLDQNFVGDTPSSVNAPSGKHTISLKKPGFQDWVREMNLSGGTITLNAELAAGSTVTASAPDKNTLPDTEVASVPTGDERTSSTPVSVQGNQPAPLPAVKESGSSSSLADEIGRIGVLETNDVGSGVRVKSISIDGLVKKAGVAAGDTITALNGKSITSSAALARELANCPAGSTVHLNYSRSAYGTDIPFKADLVLAN